MLFLSISVTTTSELSLSLSPSLSTIYVFTLCNTPKLFYFCSPEDASGLFVSLLFGLGPLLGGVALVAFALAFRLQHALLTGLASGIAFVLGCWRPLQLLISSKMGLLPLLFLLGVGSAFVHTSISILTKSGIRKKTSANTLSSVTGFLVSALTLQSVLSCGAIALHALTEGLALGVAAPKAYGLGRHMVLPVSLHGFPRGAAVASCIFGATDSWHAALLSAALIGFVGPLSAIGAILAGIDYSGLDHLMVFACGGLFPCFGSIVRRAVKLDKRKSIFGFVVGAAFASVCLMCTKLVCLHTPYCNSAPEAVR